MSEAVSHCTEYLWFMQQAISWYSSAIMHLCHIKNHMLEDHATQWVERWHFCPGFHGEQGGRVRAIFKPLTRALENRNCHRTF